MHYDDESLGSIAFAGFSPTQIRDHVWRNHKSDSFADIV
jgi:hypothetical protein